jgi:hypothetical protein
VKTRKPTRPPSSSQPTTLLETLQDRFDRNMVRHPATSWAAVLKRLQASPAAMTSLQHMESTGGEPDVVTLDKKSDHYTFVDCSPETPKGRVSMCYDREGLDSRKEHKPKNSAIDLAAEMGIEMLSEAQYRMLQQLGEFDNKTSSWVLTPAGIRELGGALFCDRRYGQVFTYHNGAQSYYAVRGFRGLLRV